MEKELDLVRQAKAGDVSAFAKLYEQVYEDMYRYAFYMLQHIQDAQDVVSDTVADAFASIRKLRGKKPSGDGFLPYFQISAGESEKSM